MDILDAAPRLPEWDDQTSRALLGTRRPGLGEFLRGNLDEGWWSSVPGSVQALGQAERGRRQDDTPIPQAEWRYHPLYRDGIAWDDRMTVGRARAMAAVADDNRYRREMMRARNAGALEIVLGFGGMLAGSITDPINWMPIAGPGSRALRAAGGALETGAAARALTAAGRALDRPGVGASALRGTVDAVGGNILAAPMIYSVQERFGDEVTFDRVVTDLAVGALIGAGFGTASGLLARARPDERAAVRTLDAAARDIAAGGDVSVPPAMAARAVEDAVMRSAPPEVAALVPDGARLSDLPTRPDGAPLTREEFAARVETPARPLSEAGGAYTVQRTGAARDGDLPPQGLYTTSTADGPYNPAGGPMQTYTVEPRNPLRVEVPEDQRRVAARPRWSAGTEAARRFIGDAEVDRLLALSDAAARAEAESRGITLPADQQASQRLVEIIGAQEARKAGYDAIILPHRTSHGEPPELVVLDRALLRPASEPNLTAAYDWYRSAIDARKHTERLSSAAPRADDAPPAAAPSRAAEGETRAMADADTDASAALRQIEALKAEGRIGAADEAILRAGDEAAAQLEAQAKGLIEAAACSVRRGA